MRNYEPMKRIITFVFLLIAIVGFATIFAWVWYRFYAYEIIKPFYRKGNWLLIAVYAFLMYFGQRVNEGNKVGYYTFGQVVFSQILSIGIVNVLMYVLISLIARKFLWVWPMVGASAVDCIWIILWTYIGDKMYHKLYPPRNMVLISAKGQQADALMAKIASREDKYQVKDWIDQEEGIEKILPRLKQYDAVILCDLNIQIRNAISKYCFENDIRVYVSPRISDVIIKGAEDIHLFDSPLLLCRNYGLSIEQRIIKRIMDLLISFIGLLIASPIFLLIAVAIKLDDGGPVLYKQERLTRGAKVFYIY